MSRRPILSARFSPGPPSDPGPRGAERRPGSARRLPHRSAHYVATTAGDQGQPAGVPGCRPSMTSTARPRGVCRSGCLAPTNGRRSRGLRPDPILWSELWAATCGCCRLGWRKWSQLKTQEGKGDDRHTDPVGFPERRDRWPDFDCGRWGRPSGLARHATSAQGAAVGTPARSGSAQRPGHGRGRHRR